MRTKKCTVCRELLAADSFVTKYIGVDGQAVLNGRCRPCDRRARADKKRKRPGEYRTAARISEERLRCAHCGASVRTTDLSVCAACRPAAPPVGGWEKLANAASRRLLRQVSGQLAEWIARCEAGRVALRRRPSTNGHQRISTDGLKTWKSLCRSWAKQLNVSPRTAWQLKTANAVSLLNKRERLRSRQQGN